MTAQPAATVAASHPGVTPAPRLRWMRFLAIQLPVAMLLFATVAQLTAYVLRGIQPFRNSLDTIVVAAERVPGNAPWLIFGDSLTQHVLMDYALGPPGEVANLTTHAGAGLPSMYLLLRRYLATHKAPKAIILAVSPETYANVPNETDGRFWLRPTFLRPEEQAWLARIYPSTPAPTWLPAALNLKAAVLDPLTGLLAPRRDQLVTGPHQPDPGQPVEAATPTSPAGIAADQARAAQHLHLGSTAPVLTDICRLAKQNGIAVNVIVTPMPAALRQVWQQRGDLQQLQDEAASVLARECGAWSQTDFSATIQPPNFDEGGTHIVGSGWAGRYALALKDYIRNSDSLSQ